jgi:adenylate cyclase
MTALGGAGRRRALILTAQISIVAVATGAAVGTPLSSDVRAGAVLGALASAIIATTLCCFELVVMPGPLGRGLRRLPFFALFLLRTAVYLAVSYLGFVLSHGLVIGEWTWTNFDRTRVWSLVYSGLFGIAVNFVMLVRRLAGPGVIARFVLGRYHRPRRERRYLLFLDMVGSTGAAERLGPERFHLLLNRVMYDIAGPVASHGGEIHKYVGDEAIVTWLAPESGIDARPSACVLAIQDALEGRTGTYVQEFGAAVRLRAGLHLGEVVTGELGDQRQEIAMLGDGINTAARLVDAARETGQTVVATVGSIDPASLPPAWRVRPLGAVALRGKQAPLDLLAIERVPAD